MPRLLRISILFFAASLGVQLFSWALDKQEIQVSMIGRFQSQYAALQRLKNESGPSEKLNEEMEKIKYKIQALESERPASRTPENLPDINIQANQFLIETLNKYKEPEPNSEPAEPKSRWATFQKARPFPSSDSDSIPTPEFKTPTLSRTSFEDENKTREIADNENSLITAVKPASPRLLIPIETRLAPKKTAKFEPPADIPVEAPVIKKTAPPKKQAPIKLAKPTLQIDTTADLLKNEGEEPPKFTYKEPNPSVIKLHERALDFVAKKELKKAIQIYEEIVLTEPNDQEAYLIMGHCYVLTGDYEKGEQAFQNAVHIEPQNVKQIVPFYQNLVTLNPNDANAHANLGFVWLMFGDTEAGLKSFEQALTLDPGNPYALRGIQVVESHNPK